MKINCTDVVKFLYDYDILDDVRCYLSNIKAYEATHRDYYLFESQDIACSLNEYFDISKYDLDMLKCQDFVDKYFKNKSKTRKRLAQRIRYYLSKVDEYHSVYFVTLTFNDIYFNSVNNCYDLIRRDIRDFVKFFTNYYILNKDYGDENMRLHFHGVIVLRNELIEKFIRTYNVRFGFCNLRCCNSRSDLLSRYIEKLSFHALKTSTQKEYREHVIYSRLPQADRIDFECNFGEHIGMVKYVNQYKHTFWYPVCGVEVEDDKIKF